MSAFDLLAKIALPLCEACSCKCSYSDRFYLASKRLECVVPYSSRMIYYFRFCPIPWQTQCRWSVCIVQSHFSSISHSMALARVSSDLTSMATIHQRLAVELIAFRHLSLLPSPASVDWSDRRMSSSWFTCCARTECHCLWLPSSCIRESWI